MDLDITVNYDGQIKRLKVDVSCSLLDIIRDNFDTGFSPCADSGVNKRGMSSHGCGNCLVRVYGTDINIKKTYNGASYRACTFLPFDGMSAVVCFHISKMASVTQNDLMDGSVLAIDLGSSTIAMSYRGREYVLENPQRRFGSDIMTRVQVSEKDDIFARMQLITEEAIKNGIIFLDPESDASDYVVSGNAVMVSILCGKSVKGFGEYPYDILLKREDSFISDICIKAVPYISPFIGGDILSGICYINFLRHNQAAGTGNYIFADIGTNCEMVLKKGTMYYATSAAAGAAFEGSTAAFGSNILKIIAILLEKGIVDGTGLLSDEYFDNGYVAESGYILTQKTIREIQMAKSAVRCGFEFLIKKAGLSYSDIDCLYLAGGFGFYLEPSDGINTGLLPSELGGRIISVGNSSLKGALLNPSSVEMDSIINNCECFYLSNENDFESEYIKYLGFYT